MTAGVYCFPVDACAHHAAAGKQENCAAVNVEEEGPLEALP